MSSPSPALHAPSVAAWDNPPAVGARGTVVVIAGRGEYPGVYERFGTRIAFDAYQVRAVGDPTTDPEESERQVRELLADATLPAPNVLLGSDAGALFAAALVAGGRVAADGVILVGLPVEGAGETAVEHTEGHTDWESELSARTACPTHQGRLRSDDRLRRGAVFGELPKEWYAAADLSAIAVPVLGIHGEADSISPIDRVRAEYAAAPAAQLVSILDGRHDALNDATHRSAAATVVLFLERLRLGAAAPQIARQESSA